MIRWIVNIFLDPISFLGIFLVVIFITRIFRNWAGIKHLRLLFLFVFFLITTPFLPDILINRLEQAYPPFSENLNPTIDSTFNIVVLGGGHTLDPRLNVISQLSEPALSRLAEGIRIYHAIPGTKLVFSGWSSIGIKSQAEVTAEAAHLLGVEQEDITVIPEPSNTRQEAIYYAKKFGTEGKLILVTSAVHMPRAMMHFHKAGLSPIPAPTNFLRKKRPIKNTVKFLPSMKNLVGIQKALHEIIGWYHGKYEWWVEEKKKN